MIGLPWLRIAPFAAAVFGIAALIGWTLWTQSMLVTTQTQLDAAVTEVGEFRRLATDATVPIGADGTRALLSTPDAKAALAGAFRDRDDARKALGDIGRGTVAAKTREVASDAALVRTQDRNAAAFQRAAATIARLDTAKPTGKPDEDAAAIDADSRAPWGVWR